MASMVYLVGAGPGDPGLVTVKGLELIKKADCIIYDRLSSPELLGYAVKTFSPPLEELNFLGFQDVLENGKIVVLNMNISEYAILSKIISAYLKLDFQSEVMMRLANNFQISNRSVAFISDEYHEYCTETDSNFFF